MVHVQCSCVNANVLQGWSKMLMNGCKFTGTRPFAVFRDFLLGVTWWGKSFTKCSKPCGWWSWWSIKKGKHIKHLLPDVGCLIAGIYPDLLHIVDLQITHDLVYSCLLELTDSSTRSRDSQLQTLRQDYEQWCHTQRTMVDFKSCET